jgi:MFS family permease
VLHDPYAAFRCPAYRSYSIGNFIAVMGRQMLGVAIGYEVFQRTHSATALGFVGLAGALPVILLALPAGQIADRFHRRNIIIATQFLSLCTSLALAWLASREIGLDHGLLNQGSAALLQISSAFGESNVVFGPEIPLIYGLLFLNGAARTFGWAARAPFVANLVPRIALGNAVTWGSSLFEIGSMAGPALGGFLLAFFGFPFVYLLDAVASVIFIGFLLTIRVKHERKTAPEHPMKDLFSGLRFVWNTKAILATVTLDLFAVLLGGATALLPIYADQILHVGAVGLGWLRAAPSIGAFGMALALAHLPPMRRAGVTLLAAVAGFGISIVVFGISRSFWISFMALIFTGAFDNISVVVRHTLVQLMTPDAMRGRVAAVNNVFIGSSNELGAFESGVTAALFGPVLSVVSGGIGTVLVVIAVALKWPEVRQIGSLASVRSPVESDAELEVEAATHAPGHEDDDDSQFSAPRS